MRAPENSQQEGTKADKDIKMHLGLPNLLLLGVKQTCLIHESFLEQLSVIYILIPCYLYDNTVATQGAQTVVMSLQAQLKQMHS